MKKKKQYKPSKIKNHKITKKKDSVPLRSLLSYF